jgi:hypothetical protein
MERRNSPDRGQHSSLRFKKFMRIPTTDLSWMADDASQTEGTSPAWILAIDHGIRGRLKLNKFFSTCRSLI